MKATKSKTGLPLSVKRALRKLGADIAAARKRRRMPVKLMAERAFVGRNTITRVEQGDPGVSIGIYATALFVLGLADRLALLADLSVDEVGQALDEERLPTRVRESGYQGDAP